MAAVGLDAGEAFERLGALVPAVPSSLADQQLIELLAAARDAVQHALAIELAAVRELDNRSDPSLGDGSLAAKLGHRTVVDAVEYATRSTRAGALRLVKASRSLRKLPVVEEAVARGAVTLDQAEVICSKLAPTLRVASPGDVAAAEEQLCDLAETLPADALRDAAEVWAHALDPDGIEPAEDLAMQKRFLTIGVVRNGVAKVSGLLPTEHAATVRAVLDAYANPKSSRGVFFTPSEPERNGAEPGEREQGCENGGDAELRPEDRRTPGQRRADVLRDVFAAAARDAEAPVMGGAHPTLIVAVDAADFDGAGFDGAGFGTRTGSAWLDGESARVSSRAAEQLACTGGVQRLVFGEDGEILHLGRTERIFTPGQRRAIAVRDRGCVVPGCTIPARWCEVHHVRSWREGGPTDVGNGVLLCWFHHRQIDTGPWQVRMNDGVPEVRWVVGSHAGPWRRATHRAVRARPPGRRAA